MRTTYFNKPTRAQYQLKAVKRLTRRLSSLLGYSLAIAATYFSLVILAV